MTDLLHIAGLLTTTMTSIPPELLGAIVAEVRSPSELLNLRAVNSTLNAFATPLAFRSISFANGDKSIERFKRISNSPKFAQHIREVVYQYEEADPNEPLRQYTLRGFDGVPFLEALSLVSQLPALESLILTFRSDDGPFKADTEANAPDRNFPTEIILQFLIFRALAELPTGFASPLKSLIIDRFVTLPHPYLESPPIIALLSTLTHLSIKTTSQCATFPMTDPTLEWTSPPLFLKKALASSLVSLELHHACVRSANVIVPVSDSSFRLPHLEKLSLQRIYFSKQGDVEKFIVRHGKTLVELKLFACPMALSTDPRASGRATNSHSRWAQVWEHFDRDLKVLRNLVVMEKHDSHGVEDSGLGWYVDNPYRCNAVSLGRVDKEEDGSALKVLMKNVESRSP
ncbi:hypothetical protein BC827DRAFT_1232144 [Russula dissimulans]|nr:hypothetical protein BC827DRAFT_1232144 [Russula dissimulans]